MFCVGYYKYEHRASSESSSTLVPLWIAAWKVNMFWLTLFCICALKDLIYKRGQAGVTKASVTIVFDNSDKKKSPIGFEEYAQISVTRQVHIQRVSSSIALCLRIY